VILVVSATGRCPVRFVPIRQQPKRLWQEVACTDRQASIGDQLAFYSALDFNKRNAALRAGTMAWVSLHQVRPPRRGALAVLAPESEPVSQSHPAICTT